MTTTPEAGTQVPKIVGNPAPTFRADFNALADWAKTKVIIPVANLAAIGTAFPAPTQGQMVETQDLRVVWRYYAAWHATTNPSGRVVAGWYPWETAGPIEYVATLYGFNANSAPVGSWWSARAGRIFIEGYCTINLGGGFTGSFAISIPWNAALATTNARYRTNTPVGRGGYLQPGTALYQLVAVLNQADRVSMNVVRVNATNAEHSVPVGPNEPTPQTTGVEVSWSFEYQPA